MFIVSNNCYLEVCESLHVVELVAVQIQHLQLGEVLQPVQARQSA